tara:strand:- start:80 stop:277 length:198 start_codon:yes stop_codon:yes gene_type:complete
MEYRTDDQVEARGRQIVPLSNGDIDQLKELIDGVRTAADLMESLIQPFDGEIDVSTMSRTVEGNR